MDWALGALSGLDLLISRFPALRQPHKRRLPAFADAALVIPWPSALGFDGCGQLHHAHVQRVGNLADR